MAVRPGGGKNVEAEAALDDRGIWCWVNSVIPGAASLVLQNGPAGDQPGIYYDLQDNDIVLIRQVCFGVLTISDSCDFELGWTDGPVASGTFTPVSLKYGYSTGVELVGRIIEQRELTVPLPLRYSDGVRSITVRVDANDATCEIRCGWAGYVQKEIS